MGDDDVICLSSDDETTPQKSSLKKPAEKVLKTEVETSLPINKNFKRKAPSQSLNKKISGHAKKLKVDRNGLAEEITIGTPVKSSNSESTVQPTSEWIQKNAILPILLEKNKTVVVEDGPASSISESKHCSKPEVSKAQSNYWQFLKHASDRVDRAKVADTKSADPIAKSSETKAEQVAFEVKNFFAKSSVAQSNEAKVRTSRLSEGEEPRKIDPTRAKTSDDKSRRRVEKIFGESSKDPQQLVRSRSPDARMFKKTRVDPSTKNLPEKTCKDDGRDATNYRDNSTKRSLSNLPDIQNTPRAKQQKPCKTTPEKSVNGESDKIPIITDSRTNRVRSPVSKISLKIDTSKSNRTKITTGDCSKSRSNNERSRDVEIVDTTKTSRAASSKIFIGDKTRESVILSSRVTNGEPPGSPVGQSKSKIETPNSSRSKNFTEKGEIENSPRSDNFSKSRETLTLKSSRVQKTTETPRNTREKTSSSDGSTSPEVEFVGTIETPKLSKKTGVDKVSSSVGKLSAKLQSAQSSSKSSLKSNSRTTSPEKRDSDCSRIKIGNSPRIGKNDSKSSNKSASSSKTDCARVTPALDDPTVDDPKNNENLENKATIDKSSSTLGNLPVVKNIEVVKNFNRIIPKKIAPLTNSDRSRLRVPEVRKDDSPKSFEPTAGCSTEPDEGFATKMADKENKSSSDSSYMTTPWTSSTNGKSRQNSESMNKPNLCEKPQLIVKTKEPVTPVKQDTFAMFLSLCLQTDRSEAMNKIVAKLKHHYDRLDPTYSRSRAFSDLLDQKRDKIIAKGRVYYYIGQVADEMRTRKKRCFSSGKIREKVVKNNASSEVNVANDAESSDGENEADDDSGESRRLRKKIKTIEIAMKKCSKRIRELEVAEIDFDDENNSHYIKLDRYKEKMVELYTKMCEYTNEHADAGRAYLRPKHLRVTEIQSINQAINSFINSKLSCDRGKKTKTTRSFVDRLVFPEYHDILECVAKVNDQQNLGLDKRRQEKLARNAFTQLGKHLQNARQNDFWDTFSLDLENSEDPAAVDPELTKKLMQNQEIAEKNMKEMFEEYVRKQEKRNRENDESSSSDTEDNDDKEDEDDEDEKKSNRGIASESERSENEDDESSGKNSSEDENEESRGKTGNKEDTSNRLETIHEAQSPGRSLNENIEDQVLEVIIEEISGEDNNVPETNETKIDERVNNSSERSKEISNGDEIMEIEETIPEAHSPKKSSHEDVEDQIPDEVEAVVSENNNVLETTEKKIDDQVDSSDRPEEISIGDETMEIEVNHEEGDIADLIKPVIEESMETEVNHTEDVIVPPIEQPRPLRIRSFAKPPSSWACSQDLCEEDENIRSKPEKSIHTETIDVTDDEPLTNVSNPSSRVVTIDDPIVENTKNVESTKPDKSSPKVIVTTEKSLTGSINCSSIVVRSSVNQQASSLGKSVPNEGFSGQTSKQLILIPGLKIRPTDGPMSLNQMRPSNVTVSTIPGTTQNPNVAHNIRMSVNAANPMNVRVRSLGTPQQIQVRVAKTMRNIPPGRVQIVKMNGNRVVEPNVTEVSSQPGSSTATPSPMRLCAPLAQNSQPGQIRGIAPGGQQVRLRMPGSTQFAQPPQPQILRLSNGQYFKPSTVTIRPPEVSQSFANSTQNVPSTRTKNPSQPSPSITLNNPRFIRLPGAATTATSSRSSDSGQLRLERIENAPQSRQRLSNNVNPVATNQSNLNGQRIPVLKTRTSNNALSNSQRRRRPRRSGQKNSWIPPDSQSSLKK